MAVAHPLETAEIVEVHEGDEIIELEIGRHHHRFPGRALLEFAVGQHAIDQHIGVFELFGIGLACRHAEPVAERSRGRGNSRRLVIGMRAEAAIRLAIGVEIRTRQNALLLQDHVLDHAAVALRHQKHVAIVAAGLPAHQAVVEHVGDFGAGERRRDMQRADLLRNIENAAAIAETAPPRGGDVEAIASER